MRFPGFIGPSYTLQSVNVDAQRCVNLYPEMDEAGEGNEGEVMSLVGTPGLRLLATLPTGPVRGAFTDSRGQLWAVGGNVLYSVSPLFVASVVGTLNTSLGPVSMADNGLEMVLVDGPSGYSFTYSGSVFAVITDSGFQGATQVACMDGYFIFIKPATQQFYLSGINALTFSGLDVATAEAGPDNIVGQVVAQEYLYLFSAGHIEVWSDTGNNSFPFERFQGTVTEIGCSAAFSIAKIQNQIFWLGQDGMGRGIVYRMAGFQAERVSTHAIEKLFASLGDLSGARAYAYQQGGHAFYCLNLPGAMSTWCFDVATSLWHERAYLSLGQFQRHLADCHAFAYGTNVVGDYSSGNLYALDAGAFSDNGNPVLRERSAPHVSQDRVRLFHSSFELDLETGVGADGSGQGTDPQAMLQWSNDAGHSWSNEHWVSIGRLGAFKARARWQRLGQARDRVYRVRISDPVKVTLLGAELDVQAGGS